MSRLASHETDRIALGKADRVSSVKPEHSYVILIVAGGPLSGARMNLELGRPYTLGADEASDIVLRGSSADLKPMQITANDDNIRIIQADQTTRDTVAYHDNLVFGATEFFIVKSDELTKPAIIGSSDAIETKHLDGVMEAEPANTAATNSASKKPLNKFDQHSKFDSNKTSKQMKLSSMRQWLRPLSYAAGFAVMGVFAFGLYSWQTGTFEKDVAFALPIESQLADLGYKNLSVDRSSGTTTINGYVQTPTQAMKLAQLLSVQSEPVLNRVMVDTEIRDQIENVMRVNGIAGSVESKGNGAFLAHTQLPLGEQLDELQGLIESDVPQIGSFTVNNQSPELPVVEPDSEVVKLDEGKRVVLVSSDTPAYVVTKDQSRYFIGSILPGGYRITDILDGRVYLEKQGKTTELKF